jgi:acetyltransferase-like isoleucine patch superfamily enzyme
MKTIDVPFLGANDEEATLVAWNVADRSTVAAGATVATLETTKTAIDVVAEVAGIVHVLVAPGREVRVGEPIALVHDQPVADPAAAAAQLRQAPAAPSGRPTWTKKAELLAQRHGLDAERVEAFAGDAPITEAVVTRYLDAPDGDMRRRGMRDRQRIGILGGAGGGGALIVIDSIQRTPTQEAVCIFDRDPRFTGKRILGVPVVGSADLLQQWLDEDRVDAVVLAFNRDLDERARVFDQLRGRGVPFCNVVDPTADLRSFVELGVGNIILGHVYVGPCSTLGDDNFISANVALEHGNVMGSHNAFGPGVFTSGDVNIGNRIRFSTGIFVEPHVTIGDGAVLASGTVITTDVAPGQTVKGHRRG